MSPNDKMVSSSPSSDFTLRDVQNSSIAKKRSSRATSISSTSSRRRRTRTAKACDRCRFKKSKCDGHQPCNRCSKDDSPCLYSSRINIGRKASMFETLALMSEGLQMMYKAFQDGKGFPGSHEASKSNEKDISAHEILERLGLIKMSDDEDLQSSTASSSPRNSSPSQIVKEIVHGIERDEDDNPTRTEMEQQPDWSMRLSRAPAGDGLNSTSLFSEPGVPWTDSGVPFGGLDEFSLFQPLPQYPDLQHDAFFQPNNEYLLQAVN